MMQNNIVEQNEVMERKPNGIGFFAGIRPNVAATMLMAFAMLLGVNYNVFASGESSDLTSVLTTAFTSVQTSVTSYITAALPIALGIMGLIIGIRIAIKFFRSVAK